MAKELISVNENWSVLKCLREIRKQAKDIKRVHSIYVLNKKKVFLIIFYLFISYTYIYITY